MSAEILQMGELTSLYEDDSNRYHEYMAQVRYNNFRTNLKNGGYTRHDDGTYSINEKYVEHPLMAHHRELMAQTDARLASEADQ
jgi:hypothetical protein